MKDRDKIYPESGVELKPFVSKNYDRILSVASLGHYPRSIRQAIDDMDIQSGDHILDMGCGTGYNTSLMTRYLGREGSVLGTDISEEMARQFQQRFNGDDRLSFLNCRIDQPFHLDRKFQKVFISFVIHGFPHEVRTKVIDNARKHLEPGGSFYIFDFAEFDMDSMPAHHRFLFKSIECPYAFDFIKRDWKSILKEHGFRDFTEHFYMKKYVRLLQAKLS
ncbi:MAG: methyltransferase domain-containing protein [Bacteroidota bacterium]